MTVNKTKRYSLNDEDIDVEQELINDFEKINFGARSLESVDQDLTHGSEEIELEEERKTKFLASNKKHISKKVQDSLEKTAEKLNEKTKTKLPQGKPFLHPPTVRHK
jgi:hypothetical protein